MSAEDSGFDVHHPHDHFFRKWLGDPEMAAAFFRQCVPEALQAYVADPARLKLESVTFISDELRGSQSDLLWRCAAPDVGALEAYVYILFEHQRYPDPWMAARMLSYLVKFWERWLEAALADTPRRLPFVYAMVLYQGSSEWNAPVRLAELVDLPDPGLRRHVPEFEINLRSLREMNLDGFDPVWLRLGLKLMKMAAEGTAIRWLGTCRSDLEVLQDGTDEVKLVSLITYLFAVARPEEREVMIQEMTESKSRIGETARSLYEALIQEGREQGRELGREEALVEALERLVASGMSRDDARRLLGLES